LSAEVVDTPVVRRLEEEKQIPFGFAQDDKTYRDDQSW